MGCMVAQGYRFWRPMTGEAMRNLVLTAPGMTSGAVMA
jgi:predicted signal transduction protein with EAL and GGDEF domain